MSLSELIESITKSLSINSEDLKKSSKEKSINNILTKLNKRRKKILKNLKEKVNKEEKKALKEQLVIVKFHIKKTEKLLTKLTSK